MEELKPDPSQTRADLFAKEPDNFAHISELVIAMKRTPEGLALCMNPLGRSELIKALGEVQVALLTEIIKHDALAAHQRKIIQPKGSMMGFARKIFNK